VAISNVQGLRLMEPIPYQIKEGECRLLTPTTDIASLKSLEYIPKSSIQPAEVYKIFLDRSQSKDLDGLWFLTRLFFAIASPDAFYQLRDACTSVRENDFTILLQPQPIRSYVVII
jgi:hypothetical protein